MRQAAVAEAHVQPERVEHRAPAHEAAERGELGVQVAEGGEVGALHAHGEAAEPGEGREQDVEPAAAARLVHRAGDVGVAEHHVRRVHLEAVEAAAARAHPPGELPRPRVGEVLAVELPDEAEVERVGAHVHPGHAQHLAAHAEGHRAAEPRVHRAHVHVAQRVVQHVEVARVVADAEPQPPAPRGGEGRVHPRHVAQRHRVAGDVHGVADGQVAPPHHLAARAPGAPRRVPVVDREPGRVAELPHAAAHVAEREGRHRLLHRERGDVEVAPHGVGVGEAHVARRVVAARPPVGLREAPRHAAHLAVLAREVEGDRAVAPRPRERVGRPPGHREDERPVADRRRVDDDEVAEAGAAPRRPGRSLGEDPPPVPHLVAPLGDAHHGAVDLERLDEHALVEQVAHVVGDAHRARGHEQGVVGAADLDRVDRHPAEEAAAQVADVHAAVHPPGELHHPPARPLAPEVRAREPHEHGGERHRDEQQRGGAREHDAATAGAHELEGLVDREVECQAPHERARLRRPVAVGTRAGARHQVALRVGGDGDGVVGAHAEYRQPPGAVAAAERGGEVGGPPARRVGVVPEVHPDCSHRRGHPRPHPRRPPEPLRVEVQVAHAGVPHLPHVHEGVELHQLREKGARKAQLRVAHEHRVPPGGHGPVDARVAPGAQVGLAHLGAAAHHHRVEAYHRGGVERVHHRPELVLPVAAHRARAAGVEPLLRRDEAPGGVVELGAHHRARAHAQREHGAAAAHRPVPRDVAQRLVELQVAVGRDGARGVAQLQPRHRPAGGRERAVGAVARHRQAHHPERLGLLDLLLVGRVAQVEHRAEERRLRLRAPHLELVREHHRQPRPPLARERGDRADRRGAEKGAVLRPPLREHRHRRHRAQPEQHGLPERRARVVVEAEAERVALRGAGAQPGRLVHGVADPHLAHAADEVHPAGAVQEVAVGVLPLRAHAVERPVAHARRRGVRERLGQPHAHRHERVGGRLRRVDREGHPIVGLGGVERALGAEQVVLAVELPRVDADERAHRAVGDLPPAAVARGHLERHALDARARAGHHRVRHRGAAVRHVGRVVGEHARERVAAVAHAPQERVARDLAAELVERAPHA
ncbi:MAG: hypothetical protein AVDCRST_MAG40-2378 [uncultured Gemmatimonadaceae bacterium]|uniref:Uncharacterized protein n=1 Tax=uncultured Gemmatimonadaceae bacterium TaxID=246130 RepID=A0A6J4LSW4_9BACT|nr:MAG: hypothetical protein AVDCRST_MAG40-2378 [uncultured Gemmatimonadaceae bacterium]